jgi:alpha-galactosidase
LNPILKEVGDVLALWLMMGIRTKSLKQVDEIIDRILKAPGNEEMAEHFK